jgi:kinesin family protein C1
VRPLLSDESRSTEGKIFSYPTTTEASGRGIDLSQNGISLVMVYLKVQFFSYFYDCFGYHLIKLPTHVTPVLFLGQKHSFTFDKVFIQDVSQEEIFVEVSQLVQSALDGYKVIQSPSAVSVVFCHIFPRISLVLVYP